MTKKVSAWAASSATPTTAWPTRGLGTNYNSFAGTNYEMVGRCQLASERQHCHSSCDSLGHVPGQPAAGATNQQLVNGTTTVDRPYDNGTKDWQILIGFDWITLF